MSFAHALHQHSSSYAIQVVVNVIVLVSSSYCWLSELSNPFPKLQSGFVRCGGGRKNGFAGGVVYYSKGRNILLNMEKEEMVS
jgi:hypothetical protein